MESNNALVTANVKDYTLLAEDNVVDLSKRVESFIKQGWALYSSPFALVTAGDYNRYCQAVVKISPYV